MGEWCCTCLPCLFSETQFASTLMPDLSVKVGEHTLHQQMCHFLQIRWYTSHVFQYVYWHTLAKRERWQYTLLTSALDGGDSQLHVLPTLFPTK